jgi:hypothetical protein
MTRAVETAVLALVALTTPIHGQSTAIGLEVVGIDGVRRCGPCSPPLERPRAAPSGVQ